MAWRPVQIGWLSTFIQFLGTLLFNANTFDSLLPGLDWLQQDLLIWTPDIFGSICFLVSSWLALLEVCHGYWCWHLRDVSWWIVVVNLLGSIAFIVSAVYALVLPGAADLFDLWIVNLTTCIGALCFFVGAYLLFPEMTSAPEPDATSTPAG